MKVSRIALLVFLSAASTAFAAMNAPDDMKVYRVEENALLVGLPSSSIPVDPKKERPSEFKFYFGGNGGPIKPELALDENVKSLKDARLSPGNVTCTATLVDNKTPGLGVLNSSPSTNSYRLESSSGKVVVLQRVTLSFNVSDKFLTTQNTLDCFRVGPEPITAPMLRQALGPKFQLVLSESQGDIEAAKQKLKKSIGSVSSGLPSSPKIVDDAPDSKGAVGPAASDDDVVTVSKGNGKSKVE